MSSGLQVPRGVDHNGVIRMPYCPGRDIVYVYPEMIRSVVKCFNRGMWPKLVELVAQLKGSSVEEANDELCQANDAFSKFVAICCENPDEKYPDVMKRAGWEELSHPARFGYMSMLGAVVAGQLFSGLRDTSMAGDSPPPEARSLIEFWANEGRRYDQGIKSELELAAEFKAAARNCVKMGFKVSELELMLSDVKTGRT